MRLIEEEPEQTQQRINSDQLERLARFLDGRIRLECTKCGNSRLLALRSREMRLGSSPDLSAIDASQPGRPRIVFYCQLCSRPMGFIQGDDWSDDAIDSEDATRWNHLEIDEEL